MRYCIDDSELQIEYVRASGPGGQKVNKASTKAQLHWNVGASDTFSDDEKEKIRVAAGNRLTIDDNIVLWSEETRSQSQNREAVIERLCVLIEGALKPTKKRKPTKPSRGAKERRLKEKKEHSAKKASRRRPSVES